jgi:hypothetical protein
MTYRIKSLTSLILICVFCAVITSGKSLNNSETAPLIVSPSKFRLVASEIKFDGRKTFPNPKVKQSNTETKDIIIIGDKAYFGPFDHLYEFSYEGLLEQDLKTDTCQMYSMLELANSARWFISDGRKLDMPNGIYGLHRSGDELWMGTSGIGFIVFNTKTRLWSRYDRKITAVPGDHANVDFADRDYVFFTAGEFPGAAMLIYSRKLNKFLRVDYVSTKLFSEFGGTSGMVQVPVNHRPLSAKPYIRIDWTFMLPKVTSGDGQSYTFEKDFGESKTVFIITKKQIESAFLNLKNSNKNPNKSVE